MIAHHPSVELVFDFATGSLAEPLALAVATHIELCRACQSRMARFDNLGGEMLDAIEPAELGHGALTKVLAALDAPEVTPSAEIPDLDPQTLAVIPAPLRPYVRVSLERLPWRRVSRAIEQVRLPLGQADFRASLLRIKPGHRLPAHTHSRQEVTLVLAGGYTDGDAHFERGDFQAADDTLRHHPVADPHTGCMGLAVIEGHIKLTGLLGRLLNPFLRR